MTIRKPEPKKAVSLILSAFQASQEKGRMSTKEAYDLLAHLEGFKNWAHGKMALEKASKEAPPQYWKSKEDIKDWPVFILTERQNETNYDSELWIIPNAQLDGRVSRWGIVKDEDAVLMPDCTEEMDNATKETWLRENLCLLRIYSNVPNTDKYGLPYFANELGLAEWCKDYLGYSYLGAGEGKHDCFAPCDFHDTGDDSGAVWWAEVAIHPEVAKELLAKLALNTDIADAPQGPDAKQVAQAAGKALESVYPFGYRSTDSTP